VKASVIESNGEISCSVEETNRIRAMLGLKPLVVSKLSKEAEAVENFKEIQKYVAFSFVISSLTMNLMISSSSSSEKNKNLF
jgi:hypothetical protein